MAGPLTGVRIIEMGGIGPGPFCGMLLADHGAEVIRVERPGRSFGPTDTLARSRTLVTLDVKNPDDLATLKALAKTADGLIEVYRPGTMERLGLGPDVLRSDNPRLVYGRMTGWGQTGPYAPWAGHDMNYIALSGALAAIGGPEKPSPPLPLVGDFGGGGMMLAFAMSAALLHAQKTGEGQVIDCAMTEGAGLLMTALYGLHASGDWVEERESNLLDGGAHFYAPYKTRDGKFVSLGPIEPQFYALFLKLLGLSDDPDFAAQHDRARWPRLKEKLTAIFATKTRDEWCAVFEHTDACFAPVMTMAEAPHHPHSAARKAFVTVDGVVQPAPAPCYSVSTLETPKAPVAVDARTLLDRKTNAGR
jgi:alpha-methylacyl-CoA racemase